MKEKEKRKTFDSNFSISLLSGSRLINALQRNKKFEIWNHVDKNNISLGTF